MHGRLLEENISSDAIEFKIKVENYIAAERCGQRLSQQGKCGGNKQAEEENPDPEEKARGSIGPEEGRNLDFDSHIPGEHSFESKKLILLSYHSKHIIPSFFPSLNQPLLQLPHTTRPFLIFRFLLLIFRTTQYLK